MINLKDYMSPEAYNELQSSLSSAELKLIASNIEFIDEFSDATAYDEVLSSWMDEQGFHYKLQDFIDSYKLLQTKLAEEGLTSSEPYQKVVQINNALAQVKGGDISMDEDTSMHNSEARPARMEKPNISAAPPYGRCWPGFYIGDQLESILVDKYGSARGEKVFNGLLDTGNNAIYTVCGDIMREKYTMLKDMGEQPSKMDYFDINYFNLWKTWVANKGRKATKLGKIVPPPTEENIQDSQLPNKSSKNYSVSENIAGFDLGLILYLSSTTNLPNQIKWLNSIAQPVGCVATYSSDNIVIVKSSNSNGDSGELNKFKKALGL